MMEDNKGRKFAFINYETTEAAKAAIEANHKKDIRSDEQKAKDKEDGKEDEEVPEDGCPSYLLYVSRAQNKTERKIELRDKFGVPDKPAAGPGRAQGVNLFVKNLDENTTDDTLK